MGSGGDFTVTVTRKDIVAAVLPILEYWLPLSNLDLLLPPLDVSVFLCYKKPHESVNGGENFTFGSMVRVLKEAMAQALVPYYAFGGEVLSNSLGEPELLCNNHGVDFLEAYADVKLKDLDLYNPDESIEGKLVPKKKHGVLSVQVTELKCGGVVVACTFDHRIADAYSTNILTSSRAQQRQADPLISRLFYVMAEQIILLQTLAISKGSSYRRTKLESLTAFLWKMVAKSAAVVGNSNKQICKMGIVVDGRQRLSIGDEDKETAMASYIGNVLSIAIGEKTIHELKEKPLSWVADAVHDYLEGAATKELFLGLIDWVEAHRPEPALTKIYCSSSSDEPAFVMSSGQRFPVSKVDFGWGRPALGSYHFPWGGETGYVMPMPSPARDGDWVVYMHLLKGQMDLIEKEAAHILGL
ncbi:Shikimate O-hydroxycinnamoyltransferase [Vitis vinifera]|uniref:Shikimate O-hydroxycinnamoyltransferase n=1 Tax=Vitis vinifera TaxID=29760 RepID=A0A438GS53_VITVI|nr:Shikimate O-hydroxycinnamoyltransferase [Vitis vinifera]